MELRAPRTKNIAVWISADGTPLTDSGIYQIIYKMNDIPGIKEEIERLNPGERFHPHLFRHIWAKHLALSEVPGFAMMVMGGWEDLELVQHYAAQYTEEKAWSYINKASPLSNIA
jgi:integrase